MWSGELERGEKFIAQLRRFGTPIVDKVAPIRYLDWLGMFDAAAPVGRHYAAKNRSLAQLSPAFISTLVAGGAAEVLSFFCHHPS